MALSVTTQNDGKQASHSQASWAPDCRARWKGRRLRSNAFSAIISRQQLGSEQAGRSLVTFLRMIVIEVSDTSLQRRNEGFQTDPCRSPSREPGYLKYRVVANRLEVPVRASPLGVGSIF